MSYTKTSFKYEQNNEPHRLHLSQMRSSEFGPCVSSHGEEHTGEDRWLKHCTELADTKHESEADSRLVRFFTHSLRPWSNTKPQTKPQTIVCRSMEKGGNLCNGLVPHNTLTFASSTIQSLLRESVQVRQKLETLLTQRNREIVGTILFRVKSRPAELLFPVKGKTLMSD